MKNLNIKRGVIILLGAVLIVGFGAFLGPNSAYAQATCAGADIVLVLDESGSMDDDGTSPDQPITDAIDAAKIFSQAVFADVLNHRIGVVWFENDSRLAEGLTDDLGKVNDALDTGDAQGGTAIDKGITKAKNHLDADPIESSAEVIIVLSDGDQDPYDSSSEDSFKTAGGIIFAIGLGSGVNQSLLEGIATDTTHYFYSPSTAQLQNVFQAILAELPSLDADGDGIITAACPAVCATAGGCDADDQNKYVNPDTQEGLCEDPTNCTGPLIQTAWPVGGKKYANCTDYYADSNPDPDPSSAGDGIRCDILYGISPPSSNPFYSCFDTKKTSTLSDDVPTYLTSKRIDEVNAVSINNNQEGGANNAELSCPKAEGLVPCGRYADDPTTSDIDESEPCGFCSFFSLFDRIMNWIIWRIAPLAALLLLIIGGLAIATSRGSASQLTRGRDIVLWTLIGYAVMLIGWMVINSFFTGMGIKTWTGFTEETGKMTLVNTASPTSVTFTTDKTAWENDELNGLTITITKDINNPQSIGESKKIIDTINDTPKDKIRTGLWTNTPGLGAEFKIGGWWQFSCEIPLPSTPPSVTLSASPANVFVSGSTNMSLSWQALNLLGGTCTASTNPVPSPLPNDAWHNSPIGGGNGGSSPDVPSSPGDYTYTLECAGPGGTASASDTITVIAPPHEPEINLKIIKKNAFSISATKSINIAPGENVTLSWSAIIPQANDPADNCYVISGIWKGNNKGASSAGEQITFATANTYALRLECRWPGNRKASDSVLINVSEPPVNIPSAPPSVDVKINGSDGPVNIEFQPQSTFEISWTSTNATSCTGTGESGFTDSFIDPQNALNSPGPIAIHTGGLPMPASGSRAFEFEVTCLNANGPTTDSATLIVEMP